ncbi:MAG TPA: alpha/beta hydrolase [Ramlibacter sp.]|uniref:alpha/beta fold hydrolase n=1 Tax=Ramlibacter sp. TaxID=1917967 RepID=UPI002C2370FC|nr:alpha/beta hydrolase [Ramlibacter sp.]HVZ44703.1 alpha/beta hydrolase [Ramlibacter sp.]
MPEVVVADNIRVAYERTGSGPPLVLMHGAEANRQMFSALVALLAGHFEVIAYDQRDCGDTRGPEVEASLADLAHDARALIRGLGHERAHVFGSSFGGRVAQALALLHPECVDRLVLASTWPLPDSYEATYPEGAQRIGELRSKLPESAEDLAGWFFPEAFLRERPELRRIFANAQPRSARSERRARTVASTLDCPAGAIQAPTLVIAGELDRVVPAALALRLAALVPGSKTLLLPDVGHVTVMQATRRIADALAEFLCAKETPNASRS